MTLLKKKITDDDFLKDFKIKNKIETKDLQPLKNENIKRHCL